MRPEKRKAKVAVLSRIAAQGLGTTRGDTHDFCTKESFQLGLGIQTLRVYT